MVGGDTLKASHGHELRNLKMMGFQKESSLTTINFQARTVSFMEGIWLKQDSNGCGPLCFQKELTEKLFSQRGTIRFAS